MNIPTRSTTSAFHARRGISEPTGEGTVVDVVLFAMTDRPSDGSASRTRRNQSSIPRSHVSQSQQDHSYERIQCEQEEGE